VIAHSIYKEYAAEKAAMLLGDGQNGKSVFLSLVEQFLGEWNVSNQSLQKLNEDSWAANNLVGRLANVHPDMSDQTVSTMQMFKKLTGRDTVAADVKFENPIRFQNYATLIFACNRMPVLEDDTRGNWRRWILIDFPNTFEQGDDDYIPKQELMAELTTDAELQGLLARCVEEIQRWAAAEEWFPTAPDWKHARDQIRRAAEPIYDFATACLEDSEHAIPTNAVRTCYQQYAEAEGLPTMSREEFGRKLLNQTDVAMEKKQKRLDGVRRQVYDGVSLTARGEQLLEGDAESSETGQESLAGPRARAERVVDLCESLADEMDEQVSHDMLVGSAAADGMALGKAEHAIEKAREQGDLMGTAEGGYRPGR
jgi:putative DNA primase/helicase